MDLLSPLFAVVLTYREVRGDRLGKVAEEMKRCIEVVGGKTPMFVLHTCGRVEAYLYGPSREEVERVAKGYRRHVDNVSILKGLEAARHLFQVAAGLDSILIGETDVLGQLEEAYDRQVRAGYTRGLLKLVVERAIRVGKRVRTETKISQGPRGLGSLSIIYVSRLLDLQKAKVAVFGTGALGAGLAMELAARGVGKLYVLNRTFEKALEVASKVGAEARPLTREEVERCLLECDVVFSSVQVFEYIIDSVPPGAATKVVVDLGVPNSVAPSLPIKVVRIEDLGELASQFNEMRREEVAKAEAIVEEEVEKLPTYMARRYVEELAASLIEKAMSVAEEEGNRAGCPTAVLAARTTIKRTLLPIVEKAKELAQDGRLEEAVKLVTFLKELYTPT
ncbi:MAG: glutamyl-tRNA reductase [Pyrobaculum sp.]